MMKYRVKVVQVNQTFMVDVTDPCPTLRHVKARIDEWMKEELGLSEISYQLSQNRVSPLQCTSDDTELSKLEIVSGDILYVMGISESDLTCRKRPRTMPVLCDQERCRVNRFLDQPLTIAESTPDEIPKSLWNVVDELTRLKQVATPSDLVVPVLHILMLESGFVPKWVDNCMPEACDKGVTLRFDARNLERFSSLANVGWKKSGMYRLEYTPACCCKEVTLIVVNMGKVMLIHGTWEFVQVTATLQVNPQEFVHDLSAIKVAHMYHDLRRLATIFKDAVSDPLLCDVVGSELGRAANCWGGLPTEIKLKIAGYMGARTLTCLGRTSWEMSSLSNDSGLWRHLMLKDFPNHVKRLGDGAQPVNWKEEYRQCCGRQRAYRRSRFQLFPIPFDPLDEFFGPALPGGPFQPGGVIDPLNPLRPPRGFFDPQQPPGPPRNWFRETPGDIPDDREIPFFWVPGFF